MQILKGRRNRPLELVFSHCGRWLAAGGYGGVHVWDTSNPTKKPLQPDPKKIDGGQGLAFRPDGRLFFRALSGRWTLYDPAEDEVTPLHSQRTGRAASARDGRFVAEINATSVRVWRFEDGSDEPTAQPAIKCSGTAAVAIAPDGSTLVTAERTFIDRYWHPEVELTVRSVPKGNALATLEGAAGTLSELRYSCDGAHLLGFWAASVACWNLAEPNKAPQKAVNPNRKHFVSMAVHPNGPLLTVDNERLVRVWDVPSLNTDRTIEWNIGNLYAVAVSPDGTRAAVGSHNGKVLVWDWD